MITDQVIVVIIVLATIAALVDAYATFRGLEACPHLEEGNPLFRGLMHRGNGLAMYVIVLIIHLGCGGIILFGLAQIKSPEISELARMLTIGILSIRIILNLLMAVRWLKVPHDCQVGLHNNRPIAPHNYQ